MQVNKPARYTGGEFGSYRKSGMLLNMALSYPDLYEIGMSNTALKLLYNLFNGIDDVNCERVFAPAPDFEEKIRKFSLPLYTLESGIPLYKLDIIAFSVGYELTGTNILNILDLGGISPECGGRDEHSPVVIAGGPGITNPAPFGDFLDAVFIGEAEDACESLMAEIVGIKKRGGSRRDILAAFGSKDFIWTKSKRSKVRRAIWAGFGSKIYPAAMGPVASVKAVQNNGTVEIMRGCPNGCRFCHAGIYYRPKREKDIKLIIQEVDDLVFKYGYREITLLSLSSGDYSVMPALISYLNKKYARYRVSFSFPSLKVSSFTLSLLSDLREVRKSGLTFAVETPVDRWQAGINKKASFENIAEIITEAKKEGWKAAKFYFMIGLPVAGDENEEKAIVDFILRIYERTGIQLNINVGIFIPKPHTPFQFARQLSEEESCAKLSYIKNALRGKRIKIGYHSPFTSYLEGIFSRGDERTGDLMLKAFRRGARLDAWDEYSRADIWRKVIAEAEWDVEKETFRERSVEEPLPWDDISLGASKSFYIREWDKIFSNVFTPACSEGCRRPCGVCGNEVKVRSADSAQDFFEGSSEDISYAAPEERDKVYFIFSKTDEKIFLGHLDLMNIFERSFQRAALLLDFSQGFNPKPKLEFAHPLSLGIESCCEAASAVLQGRADTAEFVEKLNRSLPSGLEITEAFAVPKEKYAEKKIKSLMELYAGSLYRLVCLGIDAAVFEEDLRRYISVSGIEREVSFERKEDSFLIDISPGNKKANMMLMLKEIMKSCYPLEKCRVKREKLFCAPKAGIRIPYPDYFKTLLSL